MVLQFRESEWKKGREKSVGCESFFVGMRVQSSEKKGNETNREIDEGGRVGPKHDKVNNKWGK